MGVIPYGLRLFPVVPGSSFGPSSPSTFPTSTSPEMSYIPTDTSSPELGLSFGPSDTTPVDTGEPSQGSTTGDTSTSEAGSTGTSTSTTHSSSTSTSTSTSTTRTSTSTTTSTEEPEEDNELPPIRPPPQYIPSEKPMPTPPGSKTRVS